MIRALFFDIDGTLQRFDTQEVPDSTNEILFALKNAGYKLFIASGRPPVHIQLLSKRIQDFLWDGMILLNGQYVLDDMKQLIAKNPIPRKAFETLIPYLRENDFACSFFELDYTYDIRDNPEHNAYLKSIGREDAIPPIEDPIRALEHDVYQVCPRIPPEMDDEFVKHAPGTKSARWTDDFADIIPANGGKPEGMKILLQHYGIDQSECMAFGDGGNDITMLEFAGIGVAMGNAKDEVKEHADYVTEHINEDGIAKAVQHFKLL